MRIADFIGTGVPRLFFLVAFGLVGIGLFQNGLTFFRVLQASGWPVTEGVVLNRDWQSVRHVSRSGSTDRFIPEIRYRYTVAGQTYVSENSYPDRPEEWPTSQELRAFLDREFPARSVVRVSYDPANPARAVLILRGSYWTGITFILCGLAVLVVALAVRSDAKAERRRK